MEKSLLYRILFMGTNNQKIQVLLKADSIRKAIFTIENNDFSNLDSKSIIPIVECKFVICAEIEISQKY